MRGLIIRTHDVARERVIAHRRRKRKDQEHFLSIFKKKMVSLLISRLFSAITFVFRVTQSLILPRMLLSSSQQGEPRISVSLVIP